MTTAGPERVRPKETFRTEATHLVEVGETIRENALMKARAKLGEPGDQLDEESLFKRGAFVERFNYEVAMGAAFSIAANDQHVRAVYLFEPDANPDIGEGLIDSTDASVHLLAVVSSPSAALESFIASLDRSLVQSLRGLDTQLFEPRESILDVKLISDEDIANKSGYAVLLGSIHAPAIQIWRRGEE